MKNELNSIALSDKPRIVTHLNHSSGSLFSGREIVWASEILTTDFTHFQKTLDTLLAKVWTQCDPALMLQSFRASLNIFREMVNFGWSRETISFMAEPRECRTRLALLGSLMHSNMTEMVRKLNRSVRDTQRRGKYQLGGLRLHFDGLRLLSSPQWGSSRCCGNAMFETRHVFTTKLYSTKSHMVACPKHGNIY